MGKYNSYTTFKNTPNRNLTLLILMKKMNNSEMGTKWENDLVVPSKRGGCSDLEVKGGGRVSSILNEDQYN